MLAAAESGDAVESLRILANHPKAKGRHSTE
jgi:hypothetical protein